MLVARCSQTSNGVPALDTREAIVAAGTGVSGAVGAAEALVTDKNVVEVRAALVVRLVQSRVDEAHRALAQVQTLLVDAVDNSGNNGGGHGSAAAEAELAAVGDEAVVAEGGNVGVRAAVAVVDATGVGGNHAVGSIVGEVVGVVAEEVVANSVRLPAGSVKDVAETAAGREAVGGDLDVGIANLAACGDVGGTDRGDVRAARRVVSGKDVVVRSEAEAVVGGNAIVATGYDDSGALETELHELVALALCGDRLANCCLVREKGARVYTNLEEGRSPEMLVATVRDGNDTCGVKGVAHLVGVTIAIILGAERAVDGIEEGQEDVGIAAHLEQGNGLGVDDGVGHVKVEVRLAASILGPVGCGCAVDEVQCWASTRGNIGGGGSEELVKVLLRVHITERLEHAHGVGRIGQSRLSDAVHGLDALGGDNLVTDGGAV